LLSNQEALKKFSSILFEKISFKQFYNQLLDIPEFPAELEGIDEGFNSIYLKSNETLAKKELGKDQ
jgi:hypothetical protein